MKINVLSSYSLFVFFTFENKLLAHVKSNFKKFFLFLFILFSKHMLI